MAKTENYEYYLRLVLEADKMLPLCSQNSEELRPVESQRAGSLGTIYEATPKSQAFGVNHTNGICNSSSV